MKTIANFKRGSQEGGKPSLTKDREMNKKMERVKTRRGGVKTPLLKPGKKNTHRQDYSLINQDKPRIFRASSTEAGSLLRSRMIFAVCRTSSALFLASCPFFR